MPYKILIIISRPFDPNAGGVQRSTYKISSYLKSVGHDTHVFSYAIHKHVQQDVAQLHTAKQEGVQNNKENHKDLQNLITSLVPDVVINQMPYEQKIGEALAKVHKKQKFLLLACLRNTLYPVKQNIEAYLQEVIPKPFQSSLNNSFGKRILLKKHNTRHAKYLKFILDNYDYFVMFGPPNIEELKYFVGDYKIDKVRLIPNSILSVLPEVPSKEKRILWLSRLGYRQKRADLILPFWKKVMHQLPDWHFDIVGDGDAYDDLKQQIEKENIPRVSMYGKQVPYEYYKRSPIYIMTSAFEGFPNTLIEAQSFGAIPVVYDNYPVCSWVVKKGQSGVLIPPFDVEEMAKQVVGLAKDETRQKQLMQVSLENAREFDLQNVGKKWVELFEQELKSS